MSTLSHATGRAESLFSPFGTLLPLPFSPCLRLPSLYSSLDPNAMLYTCLFLFRSGESATFFPPFGASYVFFPCATTFRFSFPRLLNDRGLPPFRRAFHRAPPALLSHHVHAASFFSPLFFIKRTVTLCSSFFSRVEPQCFPPPPDIGNVLFFSSFPVRDLPFFFPFLNCFFKTVFPFLQEDIRIPFSPPFPPAAKTFSFCRQVDPSSLTVSSTSMRRCFLSLHFTNRPSPFPDLKTLLPRLPLPFLFPSRERLVFSLSPFCCGDS